MTELPELFDLRVKARSLAYLFTAGAVVGVLTFIFPPAAVMELQLAITWAVALLLALGDLGRTPTASASGICTR